MFLAFSALMVGIDKSHPHGYVFPARVPVQPREAGGHPHPRGGDDLFRVADACEVWQGLYDRGVLIRDFSHSQYLENCLRVSVGSPEENQVFLNALAEILNERS